MFCSGLPPSFASASVVHKFLAPTVPLIRFAIVVISPSNSLPGNRTNPALNSAGKDDKNHSWVYELLTLIGLLSGGDYEEGGLQGCGMQKAVALAKFGFGDTLYKAATTLPREQLPVFLDNR
jgi:Holliday junction resolvase YEN1